ncbi:MAG: YbaN family protein [Bacteroidales bacterium]|nr:YbaN family protein [Bacteroidales bacterium]
MKILLITLGSLSLVLGVIGIFIPLLPTTPLLLLSAWCYFRSSEKLYLKLINSKHLGAYIRNFRENKVIPIKTKIYIITLLWISLIYCIFFVANGILWLQIILAIILIGVTLHILSYKS